MAAFNPATSMGGFESTESTESNQISLFDQMFALSVNSKREPIFPEQDPHKRLSMDPMDALLLLQGPLEALGLDESDRMGQVLPRLARCRELLTQRDKSGVPLSKIDAAFITSFIGEANLLLKYDVTDDSQWAGRVPEALQLKDAFGACSVSPIEAEEVFMVRGENYLQDQRKIPCNASLFHMRGMQVVEHPKGVSVSSTKRIAQKDWCAFSDISKHNQNEWLIVNYMVPGNTAVNVVCIYTASRIAREVIASTRIPAEVSRSGDIAPASADSLLPSADKKQCANHTTSQTLPTATHYPHSEIPGINSMFRFWTGNDEYRNRSFKLFPRLCKSSWAIQAAVGKKPALIGNKKLELTYTRGENYFEIDIDLSSSSIATNILSMVRGVSRTMVVDLGIGIEGIQEDELPEAILCETRFDHVDLDSAAMLQTFSPSDASTKAAK